MKKRLIQVLLVLDILIPFIFIYRIVIKNIYLTEWIFYLLTLFALSIISLVFKKKLLKEYTKISFDKSISIFSIIIALIAFVDTSIQAEKNNIQFEKNRKASDSLFKVQLNHAQKLNKLLLQNSNNLNDSLIIELNTIQNINRSLTKSAENQLSYSNEQLKLSKQSLEDYIVETRANFKLNKTSISILDSIDEKKLKIVIRETFSNIGKRTANNFELRQGIIHKDGRIKMDKVSSLKLILPDEPKTSIFGTTITKEEYKDFFYFRQIIFFDKKLNKITNRTDYFRYHTKSIATGVDFYYVSPDEKKRLRIIIDSKLKNKGLSLTLD